MKTTTVLALASTLLSANLASAHSHFENRIRNRVTDARPTFVDMDARVKRLTTEGAIPQKRYSALQTRASLSPGYASNPALDAHENGAFFLGASLGFGFERTNDTAKSVFSANYDVAGLFFENSADENNEVDQALALAWQKDFAPGIRFRVGASDTQVDIDSDSLLNVASGFVQFESGLTQDYVGGFAYTWQMRDAQLPVANLRRDGDAIRHIPTVYVSTDLSRFGPGLPELAVSYSYYFNLADGADEDFAAHRVALTAANWVFPLDFVATLEAAYEDRAGENFSSRLLGLDRQGDELLRGQLTLSRPLLSLRRSHLALVVGYERSASNVVTANYEAWTYAATLSRAF